MELDAEIDGNMNPHILGNDKCHILENDSEHSEYVSELQNALQDLYRLVIGECPSLLDEDSGGDINLAMKIEELLYK